LPFILIGKKYIWPCLPVRGKRQVQNYFPPKPNTNFKKKSFSYRGAVAWNSLPCDLNKRSQTIQCFKNKLFNCNKSNNNFYIYGLLAIGRSLILFSLCIYLVSLILWNSSVLK
jgi:hypothetical protein